MKECIDINTSCRYRIMGKYCNQDNEPYINKAKHTCEFAMSFKLR